MDPRLKIIHDSTSFTKRPPISFKVIEYIENYVNENLLTGKKIIANGNWEVQLVLAFCEESARYKSTDIFLAKGPTTVTKEKTKIYEMLIPMKLLNKVSNPYLKTIELICEAVKIFLTATYKKITPKEMDIFWGKMDIKYLLSLPYPAPVAEQKYMTDTILANGEVGSIIQWSEEKSRP